MQNYGKYVLENGENNMNFEMISEDPLAGLIVSRNLDGYKTDPNNPHMRYTEYGNGTLPLMPGGSIDKNLTSYNSSPTKQYRAALIH